VGTVASCTAQAGTPNVGTDVSKRYGNGKTAAQIAVSRGAPDGTLITGPGNSQPHKVSDCRHRSNKSGGVDVHAVKSYSTSCTEQAAQQQVAVAAAAPCGFSLVTTTALAGKAQGHGRGLVHNKHMQVATSTSLQSNGQSCSSSTSSQSSTFGSVSSNVSSNVSSTTSQSTQSPQTSVVRVSALPATQGTAPVTQSSAPATQSTGAVLGAQTTLAKPKAQKGVLGTAAKVAGTSLPFTGFPLWIAVLVAAGLLAAGLTLRRTAGVMR